MRGFMGRSHGAYPDGAQTDGDRFGRQRGKGASPFLAFGQFIPAIFIDKKTGVRSGAGVGGAVDVDHPGGVDGRISLRCG